MKTFAAIATYLISKRLTSSQSMAKWFVTLLGQFGATGKAAFYQGEFHEAIRQLYDSDILNSELASHLLQITLWLDEALSFVEELEDSGVKILLPGDFGFPAEFAEIADKPAILYCRGNLELLVAKEKITLVGTRNPSLWGQLKAKQFAFEAANCNIVTVSGLAQGVDSLVFEETLRAKGKTIAILPQLPKNASVEVSANSLLVSEYPPSDVEISKWQFIARNRLLAALSPATVIIEAPLRSGALITADLAISYGRSVYVAIPDPNEEVSYGGLTFGIQQALGAFIQSLYDLLYLEDRGELLETYKLFIERLSQGKIAIKPKDHRHLSQADIKRYIYASSKGDLSCFESFVVELHRFGIIRERKNKMVINFSGYNSWPKT